MEPDAMRQRSRSFRTREKRGAELHATGAQGEGGRDAAAIRDTAGGDNRDLHGVDDLRHQRHCADKPSARASATVVAELSTRQPASLIRVIRSPDGTPQ